MTATEVKQKIAEILGQPPTRVQDSAVLTDLVTDSFVLVDMVVQLQDELGVRLMQDDLKDVKTVGDLLQVLGAGG